MYRAKESGSIFNASVFVLFLFFFFFFVEKKTIDALKNGLRRISALKFNGLNKIKKSALLVNSSIDRRPVLIN